MSKEYRQFRSKPEINKGLDTNVPYFYYWFCPQTGELKRTVRMAKSLPEALENINNVSKNAFHIDETGKGTFQLVSQMPEITAELATEIIMDMLKKQEGLLIPFNNLPEILNKQELESLVRYMDFIILNFPKGLPEGTRQLLRQRIINSATFPKQTRPYTIFSQN